MFKIDNVESIKKAIRVDHDFDDDLIMQVYLPGAINEVKVAVSLDEKDDKSVSYTHLTLPTKA